MPTTTSLHLAYDTHLGTGILVTDFISSFKRAYIPHKRSL
jgi:hypothetical protein